MKNFRCFLTCFYTTFISCVKMLFFFRLLMLNFEPDIKNMTSLFTVSRETNGNKWSFIKIGSLVVAYYYELRDFFLHQGHLTKIFSTNKQGLLFRFFFCRQSITKSYSHISRAFLQSVSWRIAQLLMSFIILIVVIQDLWLQLLH